MGVNAALNLFLSHSTSQSTKQLFSLGLTQDEIVQLISSQNFNLTPIT